jgi:hypothetical protein
MNAWWVIWVMFAFLFMVPVGYAWGYRGWGPPYPTYLQRRRQQRAAATGVVAAFNHRSWGLSGDFVWVVILVALFWAASRVWWR